MNASVQILGPITREYGEILNHGALDLLVKLHREFNPTRLELLKQRADRQAELDAGGLPDFLTETEMIRQSEWQVSTIPDDLQDRRVEITGPVEKKMMINALNSGAKVFMADFEDSLTPTWENVLDGQANLMAAVRRNLGFKSTEGKDYRLKEKLATLVVRPRGWHLLEKHLIVDSQPISASLFDFALYFFNNAKELLGRGTGPYFYLPKMESHREARLWNEVFIYAENALRIQRGSIKATVLIETILAAFEMEEIIYELREHMAGLNAGRWDYIFSVIKKFRSHREFVLPDRFQVGMTVPFMRAYSELLISTCHRRGAHAIGGMAANIPSRKDPRVNEIALAKVREDKEREAADGCDGTWVAHPDLVPVAMKAFDDVLKDKPNQKERRREHVKVKGSELISVEVPGGKVTENGVRNNISVALQYLESWLRGVGAVAIFNLMEDAATAEIARAQLWQWLRLGVTMTRSGRDDTESRTEPFNTALYKQFLSEELAKLEPVAGNKFTQAAEILDSLVLNEEFIEFLTLPAYNCLN